MPAVGNLAGGYHDPRDQALAEVEAAVTRARELGVPRTTILGQVANGLTGAVNGYRERLLTTALGHVADRYADLSQADAKVIENHTRGRAS